MFRTSAFRRMTVGLVAVASTAVLGLAAASAASASTTPSAPAHHVKAQLWQFDLQLSDIGGLAVNDVEGTGAIPMNRWTDTMVSANVDTFSLGGNSVTIWHDALPLPSVNLVTCTVNFVLPDGSFRIIAGTGTARHLRSRDGQFDLQGTVSFPETQVQEHDSYGNDHPRFVCPLGAFTLDQLQQSFNGGPQLNLPQPTFDDFAVQGSATVFRVHHRY